MISEALCDAENKYMSYYAENSALHHRKKLHFKIHGKNLMMIWMTDVAADEEKIRKNFKYFC